MINKTTNRKPARLGGVPPKGGNPIPPVKGGLAMPLPCAPKRRAILK
jgi:hypothetical protein